MNGKENKGLIDRYVAAVGQRLPSKIRADVERELHSSLLDAVEDQAREVGGSADEALVKTILREMDRPDKMAARYSGSQYLVGPRLYPAFLKVTRILLIVMAALFVFGLLAGSYQSRQGISLATIGSSLASDRIAASVVSQPSAGAPSPSRNSGLPRQTGVKECTDRIIGTPPASIATAIPLVTAL